MNIIERINEALCNDDLTNAEQLILLNEKDYQDNVFFWNLKGILSGKKNQWKEAGICFLKVLMFDMKNSDAWYNLAFAYEQQGELQLAVEAYQKSLAYTDDLSGREQILGNLVALSECFTEKTDTKSDSVIVVDTKGHPMPKIEEALDVIRIKTIKAMYHDAPLVTIAILAYNRLEKTKRCVDYVIKYTQEIDYELLLVDNGSSDGTLEFFNSIAHPCKKIITITENKGANGTLSAIAKVYRGQYLVYLPNDVYVTTNWLKNLLTCMQSDPSIGIAQPVSYYVSNLQSVNLQFSNLEEMQQKAAVYNVSNPSLWHERLRLITLGGLFSRQCLDVIGVMDYGFLHDFADDDWCFRVRRAGYKAVLCKDTFVHHDHNIFQNEGKDPAAYQKSLLYGKENFKHKYFGVDAWDDVNNFEPEMINMLNAPKVPKDTNIKILGIDVRCGTPILEMKNKLRTEGFYQVKLYNYAENAKYYVDLSGISEVPAVIDKVENINVCSFSEKFDYIIMGEPVNQYYRSAHILMNIVTHLKSSGIVFLKWENDKGLDQYLDFTGRDQNTACINSSISWVELKELLEKKCGLKQVNTCNIAYPIDQKQRYQLEKELKQVTAGQNAAKILEHMIVKTRFIAYQKIE